MSSFTIFKPPLSDYHLYLQKPYTLLKFFSIWLNSKLSNNPFRDLRLEILSIYAIYLIMDFIVGNGLRLNSLVLIIVSLALILDKNIQNIDRFVAPILTVLLLGFSLDPSYKCCLKFYTSQIVLIATNNMLIATIFQLVSSLQAFSGGDQDCPLNSFHHSLLCFMLLAQIRKLAITDAIKIEGFRAQNELLKAQLQNQDAKLQENQTLHQDLILILSKDLKTSLETITGKIKLLQKANIEATHDKEGLQVARLNCETSLNLLYNIQDYSKADSEDLDVHFISSNIRKALEKSWSVCREILREKGLTGDLLLHKNTPTLLMMDPQRIQQVLINLVQNAVKTTQRDFVRIIISWSPVEPSSPGLAINHRSSVKDDSLMITKSRSKPEIDENLLGKKSLDFLSGPSLPSTSEGNYFHLDMSTSKFPSGHHQKIFNTFDHYHGLLNIQVIDYGKEISRHVLEDLTNTASKFTQENTQDIESRNMGLWTTRKICQKMEGDLQVFQGINKISSSLAIIQAELSPQSIGSPTPSPSKPPIDNKPSIVSMKTMGFMSLANPNHHHPIVKPNTTNDNSNSNNMGTKKEEPKLKAMIANNVCYEQQLSKHYMELCGVDIKFETIDCHEACNEIMKRKERVYDMLFINIDMAFVDGKSCCIKIRDYERKHKLEHITIVILAKNCDDNDLRYYLDQKGPIQADYLYKQPLTLKECQNLTRLVRKSKLKKKSHIERALDALSSKALVYEKDIFQQVLLENYLKMGQIKYRTMNKEGVQKTFFISPDTVSAILYNCEGDESESVNFGKAVQGFIERRNLWKIPVIGIIGQKDMSKMEALRAAGFQNFLIKPFDYENVIKLLASPFMGNTPNF